MRSPSGMGADTGCSTHPSGESSASQKRRPGRSSRGTASTASTGQISVLPPSADVTMKKSASRCGAWREYRRARAVGNHAITSQNKPAVHRHAP